MTPIQTLLVGLRAKVKAATPAPWTASEEVPGAIEVLSPRWDRPMNLFGLDVDEMAVCSHKPDADFIAAMDPDTVGLLLDCVEALDLLFFASRNNMAARGLPPEWGSDSAMGTADAALAALQKRLEGGG